MKLIISLASLTALFVIIPQDQVVPIFTERVETVHAGSKEKKPEPYVWYTLEQACTRDLSLVRPMSSGFSPDGVPSPIHCTSCGFGVYSLAEDGTQRCSYCKHSQD